MSCDRASQMIVDLKERSDEAASASCCDFALHVDITSWSDEVKQTMSVMTSQHGVNSYRVSMCGEGQLNDEEVRGLTRYHQPLLL